MCELCGSAYFSKKGLRKHERAAHPAQKPSKPKPFKIGEDLREPPGTERGGLDLHELNRTVPGLEQNEFLNLEARHFMLPNIVNREHSGGGGDGLVQRSKQGTLPGVRIESLPVQVGREEGFSLIGGGGGGGREESMNLQMVYASGLNRPSGDSRLSNFFTPLTNQN